MDICPSISGRSGDFPRLLYCFSTSIADQSYLLLNLSILISLQEY